MYLGIDELYRFVERRGMDEYGQVGVTERGKRFSFYPLSRRKDSKSLFRFNLELPKEEKYYTDGHFRYENVYRKRASLKKSRLTNIVENLNSQMRDKISYLVRRSKA